MMGWARSKWRKDSNGNLVPIPSDTPISIDQLTDGVARSGNTIDQLTGEHIETQSQSGVSDVTFTTGINSDYKKYILSITELVPATDSVGAEVTVAESGTFQSGASDYMWDIEVLVATAGDGASDSGSDSAIHLDQDNAGSADGEGSAYTLTFYNPAGTNIQQLMDIQGHYVNINNDLVAVNGAGMYTSAAAIDGIKIQFSSGNVETFEGSLIGVMS